MADAAARVRQLDDPLLAEQAESALRKLAVDLPVDSAATTRTRAGPAPGPGVARSPCHARRARSEQRKQVTFPIIEWVSGADGHRTVEPFGLFYLNQHWYLAARAPGEMR